MYRLEEVYEFYAYCSSTWVCMYNLPECLCPGAHRYHHFQNAGLRWGGGLQEGESNGLLLLEYWACTPEGVDLEPLGIHLPITLSLSG